MLLPPKDAVRFLLSYRDLLRKVMGKNLDGQAEYAEARDLFYTGEHRVHPPTRDRDLLAALKTAIYGDFVVGRHLERNTEMVGPKNRVYWVLGITTEIAEMAPSWLMIKTVVMQYRGHWICDGLIRTGKVFVDAEKEAELREILRKAKPVARLRP